MKKLKLLLLLCLTFSLPANGIQLPPLHTYLNSTTATAFAAITFFIGFLLLIEKKFKANAEANPIAPQAVKDFILKIAQKRDCNNIIMSVDESCEYAARWTPTTKYIRLSQENVNILNKAIIENDQNTLNLHTGIIHHELTHLKRKSNMRAALVLGLGSAISTFASLNLFNKYAPKNWKNCIAPIPFVGTGQLLNFIFTSYIIKQHEEIKADEGIPQKKKLLEAVANNHEEQHIIYMNNINIVKTYSSLTQARQSASCYSLLQLWAMRTFSTKSFEQSSFLREIVFDPTHPSNKFRVEKFRARITAIEATEKNAQKNK